MWSRIVCTHSGVQLYDPFTDSFSPAALLDGQPSGQVSAVTEHSGGELWAVGNTLSAIHVDGDGLSLSRLPLDAQLGYADYAVEDKDFNFWVVKHNKGNIPLSMTLFDPQTNYKIEFLSKKFRISVTMPFINELKDLNVNYSVIKK